MRIARLKLQQQGAALMVMLVILVVGIAAILVGSLNSSAVKIARQNDSSAALAQAKEALISNAATYVDIPGSLPCPDTDNDGISDAGGATECPSYIGRLPWKTLGLPDLRDGSGERLWYTLSNTVRRYDSVHPLNSDTQGTLNITGTQTASKVMAIIFAAGSPVATQNRSSTDLTPCTSTATSPDKGYLCANNYLEGTNKNKSTATAGGILNISYQTNIASSSFNDQLLVITHEQLFPVIEQRIAREVKACLDGYAKAKGNKYPWAVPAQSWYFMGETGTQFGRMPYQAPLADPKIKDFLNALGDVQNAVNACAIKDSNANANILDSAGKTLEKAAEALVKAQPTTPAIPNSVTTPGKQAGDNATSNNMCDTINANQTSNSVKTQLNSTITALTPILSSLIANSNSDQAILCDALFKSNYWQDWKNLVFYQVDDKYTPTGNTTGNGSIKLNNAGNYRATVLVARQIISPQNRSTLSDPPTGYLEGGNAHTAVNPANTFTSNRPVESGFTGVNDLVLCLDGQQTCK